MMTTLLAIALLGSPTTAGPCERFDADGRLIERIWPHDGRLLQYTWDTMIDRVSRIDGGTQRDGVVWTHCFAYDAAGALTKEWDCAGDAHALDAKAAIDMERGSALAAHTHGGGK